jgi:hypothetical protein
LFYMIKKVVNELIPYILSYNYQIINLFDTL